LREVDKFTSKKYSKTINLLCEGNKVIVKYQVPRGVTPTPLTYMCVSPAPEQWRFYNLKSGEATTGPRKKVGGQT